MLENFNDYLSFFVLIILVIAGSRLLSGAISYSDEEEGKRRHSILFDYTENEDE